MAKSNSGRSNVAPGDLREAGRGFLLITGAKIWFLVTATFTSLAFPRLFDDAAAFGRFRVVSGLINVVTMVVVMASVQTVARLASEAGANLRGVRRTAMVVQMAVFGPVFLALFLGAGVIAEVVLKDEALATPLRIASIVVLVYAVYTVLIGLLNGTRNYGRQAGLDVVFSTLKTTLMVAAVIATGSAAWAFGGFAATAMVMLILALPLTRAALAGASPEGAGPTAPAPPTAREFLRYLLPLAAYALVLNLLLQIDVVALKAALGRAGAPGAADAASAAAGIYGATRNVSLLPYQAVISLTFVVFPFVSRATSAGDRAGAGVAATGALRLAAVLSWAAVAFFGAAPADLLGLLFGPVYAAGGPVLVPLLAAGALLAMAYVGNSILASAGHPAAPLWGGVGSVVILAGGLWAGLSLAGDDQAAMAAAAWATFAAGAAGAAVTGALIAVAFQGAPWLRTAAFSAVSAGAGLLAVAALPDGIPGLARTGMSVAVFLVVLVATRAVGPDDGRILLRAFARRR